MKRVLILTALLLASGQSVAAFYSTEYLKNLIDSCNSLPETFDASSENFSRIKDCGLSTGYILGVFDSLSLIADRSRCFPGTVTSEQLVDVVTEWIQKHPEQINDAADRSIKSAVSQAWTCAN